MVRRRGARFSVNAMAAIDFVMLNALGDTDAAHAAVTLHTA
ncbi:hypothetical protein [Streptomyces brasiliensis]|uniref:Uncharacterized protein n=1 Tax=Streptomyces brasiliensis TaxID=1954 RepID=A0A917NIG8_9ACTN|nr:hypothetical protein GCM10010121_012490 [Streptomyces brasiliensis]